MTNFRPGYLEQGSPLGMVNLDVMLIADNTAINVSNCSLLRLYSDDTTAGNRTFTITDGPRMGQMLVIAFMSGSSTAAQLADSGNVALSAAWEPTLDDTIVLCWQGAKWVELARANN